uniref:Receptor-interacting serine-threonine kinase 3 like n=3 Tax=Nothobranchius TaxID=28779 RepID=A0A1A8PXZ0_9TELE
MAQHFNDQQKAKFVDDMRATLIQRNTVVMPILDELGNMVHRETYSSIKAEKTHQGQMRKLYETSLSSTAVKAAFFDSLKKNNPYLIEDLGG